ncbi:MAG: hypothetical protein U0491_00440 [Candidatus Saccharimonadales bacterium]
MDNNPKSQVVERLKEAQNVLVTVSNNPSVDQLSAAIGLTLMMNKLGKHATAVFSGQVPSTIEFLKPEDTLEQNTDSLRDFIISLDKSKADKLRYKVEEDVVKIFITPYKTSLSEADLNFSQGDFNVDVVLALGVDQREHIDQAIMAHGRILHDATVIGVMAGQAPVDVGSINWQDPSASSLCEMLVSISEAFQSGLLDSQMSTAFLTGIVAETERFSNDKTSPKVMTMSAQLMAAGANQQLIANELTAPVEEPVPSDLPAPAEDQGQPNEDGEGVISLHADHIAEEAKAYEEEHPEPENKEEQIHIDEQGTFQSADDLAKAVDDVQLSSRQASLAHEKVIQPLPDEPPVQPEQPGEYSKYVSEPPQMGGTLTGSTQEDVIEPSVDPLSAIPESPFPAPDFGSSQGSTQSPLLSVQDDAESVKAPDVPVTESPILPSSGDTPVIDTLGPQVSDSETLADIEKSVEQFTGEEVHAPEPAPDADAARQAVLDAMSAAGYDPNRPEPLESVGAQPLGENLNVVEPQVVDTPPTVPPPIVPPPFPLPDENGNLPPQV